MSLRPTSSNLAPLSPSEERGGILDDFVTDEDSENEDGASKASLSLEDQEPESSSTFVDDTTNEKK